MTYMHVYIEVTIIPTYTPLSIKIGHVLMALKAYVVYKRNSFTKRCIQH